MHKKWVPASLVVLFLVIAAESQAPTSKHVIYGLPNRTGALEVTLGDLRVQSGRLRGDGSHLAIVAEDGVGIVASFFVWKAEVVGGSKGCREQEWPPERERKMAQQGLQIKGMKRYESGEMALVEYLLPEFRGVKVNQKSVHGYLATGDMCAEVHLTKTGFREEDDKRFQAILGSAHMLADYRPDTMAYLNFGTLMYREQNFGKAAEYYRQVVEMDAQAHQLSPTQWKVLIDQLGMSYGMSGDLKRAKETFEYGLSKDSTYPLFYYNLACAYAEMGDLDGALANLGKAFEYKQNVIPGERMPDPRADDSFKRYLDNDRFRQLMKSLKLY